MSELEIFGWIMFLLGIFALGGVAGRKIEHFDLVYKMKAHGWCPLCDRRIGCDRD